MRSVIAKGAFLGMLGASTMLAGCGGGGGGGGGSSFSFTDIFEYGGSSPSELFNAESAPPLPTIPSAALTITSVNQNEVADAAESGIDGAVLGGGAGILAATFANSPVTFSAFKFAEDTLFKYLPEIGAAQAASSRVVMSVSGPCDSGSLSISVDVANPGGGSIVTGDSLTMSFNNCYDAFDGSTVDGAMMFTLNSGSLNFDAGSFSDNTTISLDFNNMSNTTGGQTSVIHGGFSLSTDGTTDTLSGTSLYVMDGGGEAALLTNFVITGITSGTGLDEIDTMSVSFTLASTAINGVVNVQTDSGDPLVKGAFENHAHAGTLIITGGSSTLTMVILSSTQVSLSLDSDSNGTADDGYPVTLTWTEIENG